jgi:ABC-type polar amino acid transport system ATPase subunit
VLLVHVNLTFGWFCVVFDTFELHQHIMKTTNVTIEIFEVHNIISATMANQVKVLLDSIGLLNNLIVGQSHVDLWLNLYLNFEVSH